MTSTSKFCSMLIDNLVKQMNKVRSSQFFNRYNGVEGLHTKVTEFVKDTDCLVCGPGVLIELEKSISLKKVLL